jgi:hypothetical protein
VMLYLARHYDEALVYLRRARELDPSMRPGSGVTADSRASRKLRISTFDNRPSHSLTRDEGACGVPDGIESTANGCGE